MLLVGMRNHAHEQRQLGQLEAGLSELDHFVGASVGQRRERGVADRERFLQGRRQFRLRLFLVGSSVFEPAPEVYVESYSSSHLRAQTL